MRNIQGLQVVMTPHLKAILQPRYIIISSYGLLRLANLKTANHNTLWLLQWKVTLWLREIQGLFHALDSAVSRDYFTDCYSAESETSSMRGDENISLIEGIPKCLN